MRNCLARRTVRQLPVARKMRKPTLNVRVVFDYLRMTENSCGIARARENKSTVGNCLDRRAMMGYRMSCCLLS